MSSLGSRKFAIVCFDNDPNWLKERGFPQHMGLVVDGVGYLDISNDKTTLQDLPAYPDKRQPKEWKYDLSKPFPMPHNQDRMYLPAKKGEYLPYHATGALWEASNFDKDGKGDGLLGKYGVIAFNDFDSGAQPITSDVTALYKQVNKVFLPHDHKSQYPYNCRGFIALVFALLETGGGGVPRRAGAWQWAVNGLGLPELAGSAITADAWVHNNFS